MMTYSVILRPKHSKPLSVPEIHQPAGPASSSRMTMRGKSTEMGRDHWSLRPGSGGWGTRGQRLLNRFRLCLWDDENVVTQMLHSFVNILKTIFYDDLYVWILSQQRCSLKKNQQPNCHVSTQLNQLGLTYERKYSMTLWEGYWHGHSQDAKQFQPQKDP